MALPIDMMREFCTRFCKEEDIENAIEELQKIVDSTLIHIGRHLSETDAPAEKPAAAKPAAAKPAAKKSTDRCKCEGKNKKGEPCRFYALEGKKHCKSHQDKSSDGSKSDSAASSSKSDDEPSAPKTSPKKTKQPKAIERLKSLVKKPIKVKSEEDAETDDGF